MQADFKSIEFSKDSPLMNLKKIYFRSIPEVCVERPRLVTRFHQEFGLFAQGSISNLDKARVYRSVLKNRKPVVWHTTAYERLAGDTTDLHSFPFTDDWSPFAGSTTSKFKGVLVHPELMGLILWPELLSMTRRLKNPFQIAIEDIDELNLEIFPQWMSRNVLEIARERSYASTSYRKTSRELKLMQQIVFYMTSKPLCISHTIPDFSKAVRQGLRQMIQEAQLKEASADDKSRKEFYLATAEVLEGIIEYANNLAREAETLAMKEPVSQKRDLLTEIARRYRRVPEQPAQTFKEALTTVWIVWTALHLENANVGLSLGRLDQVLHPFYKEDIESKRLDAKDALELLCYFWLKIGDHVPIMTEAAEQLFGGTGSNQAITIGGVDRYTGNDAVNDVTYLILRATEIMKLRDPNLNARYYPGKNPPAYLNRICEVNINTGATPAIHNDPAVIKALMSRDDTEEQANDYGIVGCVEPVSAGRAYAHCAAVLINLPSVLDLTLYNGRHRHTGDELISMETGDTKNFSTFGQFLDAFAIQAQWMVDHATILNKLLGEVHQGFYPTPILSSFFEGPMDKGKDLIQGGAQINSSGATVIGLADTADSLTAIEQMCFPAYDTTKIPISKMIQAIEANFEGYESLREQIMKAPKYGNDAITADSHVNWLVKLMDDNFRTKVNYRGGSYRVGYWTMTIHAGMSKVTGAMPNGRRSGENFSSGITPVSGVTPYLTSALNSVAQLPGKCLSSGMALNIKLTPEPDRERMLDNLVSLVDGYFKKANNGSGGGLEIQFNIIDREHLERVIQRPERYPDLLVRVSGYTAYFKDLNRQMQKEIIERSEYLLSPGQAHRFRPFDL